MRRRQRGMTLIEMLVVLAILATISVSVSAIIFSAGRSITVAQRFDERAEIHMVRAFIRTQIEGAIPYADRISGNAALIVFDGRAEELSFVSASPGRSEQPGLYLTRLSVNDAGALILSRTPYRMEGPTQDRTLLEHIEAVRFSYTDNAAPDGDAQWASEWTDQSELPSLIAIDVKIGETAGGRWERLLTHPRLRAP